VRTHFEHAIRPKSQRLADLKNKTAELERRLSRARLSLERELAQSARRQPAPAGQTSQRRDRAGGIAGHLPDADMPADHYADAESAYGDGDGDGDSGDELYSSEDRTEVLVSHGRRSAYRPGLSRGRKMAAATALAALLITIGVLVLSGGSASWPASVATVQIQAAKACQNPDVKSEPDQVNFACAPDTRQILWVFALMTSADNPAFADANTGRQGLEPITPAQGGVVAWSLNLHHPYNPANPIDSLAVAARAINSIIGGATLTDAMGRLVIQPGLESNSANCVRYTGSAAVTSRKGFPGLCARPVSSPAGQAALVADVYQRWVVGAAPRAAQNAAVLFENATNPGDPRVQAILRQLLNSTPFA
jgi:hypothetical protein